MDEVIGHMREKIELPDDYSNFGRGCDRVAAEKFYTGSDGAFDHCLVAL